MFQRSDLFILLAVVVVLIGLSGYLFREQAALQTEIDRKPFQQGGSLYQVTPLAKGAVVVATAELEGAPVEPVAWTSSGQQAG